MNTSSNVKMNILKLLAIMVICLVVANIILYAMGKLSTVLFWVIIIIAAIIAYWVLPRIRKSQMPVKKE